MCAGTGGIAPLIGYNISMTNATSRPTVSPIRRIRDRLNMPQRALAALIGVTQGMVGNYETHRHEISPAVARRLVEVARERGVSITLDQVYGLEPVPAVSAATEADA